MAGPSKNTQLTAKETEMLVAVVSLMGDVPAVDFEKVAPLVGHQYARNARASCKKLFEKLKSNAGAGDAASASGAGAAQDDSNEEAEDVKKSPAKAAAKGAASKATAKTAPKKTVGKTTAPKKAAAGGPKAKGKGSKVKKEVVKEESEDDSKEDVETRQEAGEEGDDEDGKSPNSVKSEASAAQGNEVSVAGNPANDYTEDEIYEANYRDITVEEWRVWAAENNWDPHYAPTPNGYVSDAEA